MDRRRLASPTGTPLLPLERLVYQELKPLRQKLDGINLVIAVSGGIDSVGLLHIMAALQTRFNFKLYVVHINHGVRGVASDQDSTFVGELAKKLKVSIIQKKVKGLKKNPSENTLRQERYRLLHEAQEKVKSPFIVTAHHQDDLLETRLMRLLHGTGVHGLKAMTLLSNEGVLRPLIGVTRRDVENYCRSKKLTWRNDATNFDTTKFRNWIRRNWLGVLRAEHPEYVKTLALSLERIGVNQVENVIGEATTNALSDRVFKRELARDNSSANTYVYNYLRHYAKKRVTSRLVEEFKKQLLSPKKRFSFRLAGVDWVVDQNQVHPKNLVSPA